ncbi:MAG: hypothetical protein Q8O26_00815 [Phreatobacter sp.]|uniref:hypothetical protein n=1 Tax=Phreatobacter sp. TaxID=1966341 RepID=UPI0027346431|nr:hypothetical protein [Phreatobacter sp.]MDP2800403.1 hypothetical protein [Phreatobacter sp.]
MTEATAKKPDSAAAPSPVERLRAYLSALPEAAKQLLSAEIKRARARGEDVPGGDLIIAALRMGDEPASQPAPAAAENRARADAAPRLLFRPLDPFLIDERLEVKVRGRIMRASLTAIWTFLKRDLMPDDVAALEHTCRNAEITGDEAPVAAAIAEFVPKLSTTAYAALEHANAGELERKKLNMRLGDERAREDLADVLAILNDATVINGVIAKAPAAIKNLADEGLANARAMLDPMAASRPGLLPFSLALFQSRLTHRAQLVRLAVLAADSDEPSKIAAIPYRAAVDLVIGDIERSTQRVARAIKEGRGDRAAAGIKEFHDSVRSLRTDMSLTGDGPWQRRVAKLRSDLATLLTGEIEGIPGEVRRLIRPRQRTDQPMAPITEEVVTEVEARLDLLLTCRNHASEIALNELTTRAFSEIQGYLDPTLTQLMENIRSSPDVDRALKISQIEAAVRFSARIFGASYAQLLQKAADVAINSGKGSGR